MGNNLFQCVVSFSTFIYFSLVLFASALAGWEFCRLAIQQLSLGGKWGTLGGSFKVLILVIIFFPVFRPVTTEYSHSVKGILIISCSKSMVFFSQTATALQI